MFLNNTKPQIIIDKCMETRSEIFEGLQSSAFYCYTCRMSKRQSLSAAKGIQQKKGNVVACISSIVFDKTTLLFSDRDG